MFGQRVSENATRTGDLIARLTPVLWHDGRVLVGNIVPVNLKKQSRPAHRDTHTHTHVYIHTSFKETTNFQCCTSGGWGRVSRCPWCCLCRVLLIKCTACFSLLNLPRHRTLLQQQTRSPSDSTARSKEIVAVSHSHRATPGSRSSSPSRRPDSQLQK